MVCNSPLSIAYPHSGRRTGAGRFGSAVCASGAGCSLMGSRGSLGGGREPGAHQPAYKCCTPEIGVQFCDAGHIIAYCVKKFCGDKCHGNHDWGVSRSSAVTVDMTQQPCGLCFVGPGIAEPVARNLCIFLCCRVQKARPRHAQKNCTCRGLNGLLSEAVTSCHPF